ncbi:transmembrane protein, putative (macronuclear) [Tetrahymena thermophila SB210]|uniref:Transmembrane protein, putative n=1 Tax=Tetrahymena thermophila (strain SB210) TaxID=312017 RepID=W7X0V9_TETTS|nr:transmembrane protein, putative [Tetrahymena thermophila SB210]EWS72785.1 transmembrane protein, putative [Tetrahymena thermophila SB210]|eukprot:XP_012654672.1 transmembrane protein, putative [Tetrahymena thermophila SB210]
MRTSSQNINLIISQKQLLKSIIKISSKLIKREKRVFLINFLLFFYRKKYFLLKRVGTVQISLYTFVSSVLKIYLLQYYNKSYILLLNVQYNAFCYVCFRLVFYSTNKTQSHIFCTPSLSILLFSKYVHRTKDKDLLKRVHTILFICFLFLRINSFIHSVDIHKDRCKCTHLIQMNRFNSFSITHNLIYQIKIFLKKCHILLLIIFFEVEVKYQITKKLIHILYSCTQCLFVQLKYYLISILKSININNSSKPIISKGILLI